MSFSIAILSVFAAVVTAAVLHIMHVYDCSRCAKAFEVCIGSLLVLALLAMSMAYRNLQHMAACMKYDHVVVVDWNMRARCPVDIDISKIVYSEDYWFGGVCYRMCIMAWNDITVNDKYQQLTRDIE